jgi:hypothetical protein
LFLHCSCDLFPAFRTTLLPNAPGWRNTTLAWQTCLAVKPPRKKFHHASKP